MPIATWTSAKMKRFAAISLLTAAGVFALAHLWDAQQRLRISQMKDRGISEFLRDPYLRAQGIKVPTDTLAMNHGQSLIQEAIWKAQTHRQRRAIVLPVVTFFSFVMAPTFVVIVFYRWRRARRRGDGYAA